MKRGITLVDLLLTISLSGLLFAGGYRLVSAQRRALRIARDNNIALFALEGLRNRILYDIMVGYAYDADRGAQYAKDLRLPYPVTLKIVGGTAETASQKRLELRMTVPRRMNGPERTYIREVILP